MTSDLLTKVASRLMRQPAVAYHEQGVWTEVEAICAEHGLACGADRWGNRLVTLATAPKRRPFVLVAHMDHPGFEIVRRLGPGRWKARFLGGVGDAWFKRGVPVWLMPGGIAATLGKRLGKARDFEVIAKTQEAQAGPPTSRRGGRTVPRFGVWEMEDFAVRRGRIHGRACDDLIGVATILAMLIELKRRRARVHVVGLITRAEEVGFQGALAAVADGALPRNALVVSLETSKEIPPVRMGGGVILRVGDRASIFDTQATRFLAEVAGDWQRRDPLFRFQRALMSGGTCEATVFQEFGLQTAAVCVALGHYHNCAPGNRIRAEYVSLADAVGMARLLGAAARRMPEFDLLAGRLNGRLDKLLREGRRRLRT
jgi:putative aminopeptidase FrvX